MCTLVAAVKQDPGAPLVVAANRDERLDRPSQPPSVWPGPQPFVAGKDVLSGGTWLGVNRAGVFVGVTNRFGVPKDESRVSRGVLVVEALASRSARELHQRLAALAPARFNAFHLLYADVEDAFVTWSDGGAVHQEVLRPGVHVITERSLGGDDRARTELIRSQWAKLPAVPDLDSLFGLLRHHRPDDPLGGTCVHAPAFGYGTRSSAIVRLGRAAGNVQMWWSEGSPCQGRLEPLDVAGLLRTA
jgi:uncharacterized protein with NRDE domain